MGFVQREMERLGRALEVGEADPRYPAMFAAQLALSWAIDPYGFTSPSDYFMPNTRADSGDCLAESRPQP